MFKVAKSYIHFATLCVLTALPIGASAGGTPEDVKAFKENKVRAEAIVGFDGYPGQSQAGQEVDAPGKPSVEIKVTPGAFVANAYLSGIGVDRDEETALLWYFRVEGQKGLNEEGFKTLIRSMPGQQLYAVKQRRSEEIANSYKKLEQTPRVVDQTFRSVFELKSSSADYGNQLDASGVFIFEAASSRARMLLVEESIRSGGAGALLNFAISYMEHCDYKPFGARVSFTKDISGSDREVFEAASGLIKARIAALIKDPRGADSGSLMLVAASYEKGRFGLNVDPEQHKRWEKLATEAWIAEAKVRREEADSSGPEVWLQLAQEIKWALPEVKEILGEAHSWGSRYVDVMTLKAEAGDHASRDGLIAYYTAEILAPDGIAKSKGISEGSLEREQLIRWISERHKISRSPEDAIILAHHYAASGRSELVGPMVNQYVSDLTSKAKKGSFSDILKVALLSDPNWYEKLEGDIVSFSTGEIRQLLSRAKYNEFYSFREHGRLLKQFGKVGQVILYDMEESSAANPVGAPNLNPFSDPVPNRVTSRSLFVKYFDAYFKHENSKEPLFEDLQDYQDFAEVAHYLSEHDQRVADQYHEVKGGSRDHGVALRWHRILAGMGDHWSLMMMAASFEQGRGVPRDSVSAYAHYALAGSGPSNGPFPSDLSEAYQNTKGTNEQKLDACFKLTPADKERALKIYNDLVANQMARLEKLASKGGEQIAKRELKVMRDYELKKAAKAKPTKK